MSTLTTKKGKTPVSQFYWIFLITFGALCWIYVLRSTSIGMTAAPAVPNIPPPASTNSATKTQDVSKGKDPKRVQVQSSKCDMEDWDRKFEEEFRKSRPLPTHQVRKSSNNIAPNIVHYVLFQNHEMSFVMYVCIRSVIVNHKPDLILIHCDCDMLVGKYWDKLKNSTVPIYVRKTTAPVTIFGQKLAQIWHASDIMRLRVMLEFGGIYLDNDVFVIRSLDEYRKYEFTLGWKPREYIGSQVLIGEKNATFSRLTYDTYHKYVAGNWYYNIGHRPMDLYLNKNPQLANLIEHRFMHRWPESIEISFKESFSLDYMRRHYDLIHLCIRGRAHEGDGISTPFDEVNIKTYNRTFGFLARSVL